MGGVVGEPQKTAFKIHVLRISFENQSRYLYRIWTYIENLQQITLFTTISPSLPEDPPSIRHTWAGLSIYTSSGPSDTDEADEDKRRICLRWVVRDIFDIGP